MQKIGQNCRRKTITQVFPKKIKKTYTGIQSVKGRKIDLELEAIKCRNLGEKKKGRYLAELRLMLRGKWARRSQINELTEQKTWQGQKEQQGYANLK